MRTLLICYAILAEWLNTICTPTFSELLLRIFVSNGFLSLEIQYLTSRILICKDGLETNSVSNTDNN